MPFAFKAQRTGNASVFHLVFNFRVPLVWLGLARARWLSGARA
jgi:hypothetical protein